MVKYNQGTEQRVNNKMRFCKFFKFILDGSCIMIIFKLFEATIVQCRLLCCLLIFLCWTSM